MAKTIKLPRGKFGAIYADPPWRFLTRSAKGRDRCPDGFRTAVGRNAQRKNHAARHYKTMSLEEIKAMPVANLAADDCILFLWAIDPMLPQAFEVAAAWGFEYKTVAFVWAKTKIPSVVSKLLPLIPNTRNDLDLESLFPIGTGYWTRANPEICLLFTKGSPKRLDCGVRKLIVSERREHSRKPDCVHGRIERLVGGPYVELFGRRKRKGWTVWGNQTDKFK